MRRTFTRLPSGPPGSPPAGSSPEMSLPMLLTVDDTAVLLRTTRTAVYAMVNRRQLPGVTRIGRRVLVRRDDLLHWLRQKSAPSLEAQR
jgi:excisionase family DNA binding protein